MFIADKDGILKVSYNFGNVYGEITVKTGKPFCNVSAYDFAVTKDCVWKVEQGEDTRTDNYN